MRQYPKINPEAILAVVTRCHGLYKDSVIRQHRNVFDINLSSCCINIDRLIGLSLTLTGRHNEIDVYDSYEEGCHLCLCIGVSDLLPEFIIDGEFISDEPVNIQEEDE